MCLEVAVGRLSAGGWACIPPCWLFGLRGPNTGACGLLGGVKSWHQKGSLRESLQRGLFAEANSEAPSESYSRPHLPRRPTKTCRWVWPRLLQSHCPAPSPSAVASRVRPPAVESLFLPVLSSSCTQVPLAFKARCSGGSSSLCQTPSWGA